MRAPAWEPGVEGRRLTPAGRRVVAGCAVLSGAIACAVTLRADPLLGLAILLAGCAMAVASVAPQARRLAPAGIVLMLAGLGLARGGLGVPRPGDLGVALPGPGSLRGVVRDLPAPRGGETLVTVAVDELSGGSPARGVVVAAVRGRVDLLPGDRVEIQVSRLRPPDDRPGPLSGAALARQGVDAVAVSPRLVVLTRGGPGLPRALAALRSGIAAEVRTAVPEPDATLLTAVAFGIHGPVPPATSSALQDTGLVHLEATSGLKVAIVAGLAARLLAALALPPRKRAAMTVAGVVAYVAIAGGGVAAVRAAVVAAAAFGVQGSGRRIQALSLLALTAAAMLVLDPGLCLDLGFQLSFLGTLGILLLSDPLARRLPGPRVAADAFALTVAAEVATLPVQAHVFGTISLVGPLANAVVIPVVPLLVVLAWAGVALGLVAAGPAMWLLALAGILTRALEAFASALDRLPVAAVHVPSWPAAWTWAFVLTALALLGARRTLGVARPGGERPTAAPPGRSRAVLAVVTAATGLAGATTIAVAAARPDGRLHLAVLDVGAGTAVLVRTGDGAVALVDGGPDPARLLVALGRALPPLTHTIDLVVLTGGERAATGGLADLRAHYAVRRVVLPEADLGTAGRTAAEDLRAAGAEAVVLPVGVTWRWGSADWRCVGTPPADPPVAPVAAACALQVAEGPASALILGDMAPPAQDEIAGVEGPTLRSDLLVTPSGGQVAVVLALAVRPSQVAVPCSRAPRVRPPIGTVRTTAEDGTLDYADGGAGMGPG